MKGGNKKVVKVEQEKEIKPTTTTTSTSGDSGNNISEEILNKLNVINDKIKLIYDENKKKMLAVEHKFNEQLKSQFKKRSELLQKSKDFQGFWGNILSQAMIDNFADNDQMVVDLITNIEIESNINLENESTSRKITFYFKDNSIFKNKVISKEIITDKDGESKCLNTKIEYSTNANTNTISTKSTATNNNKKRKQVDFSEQSFILTWLASDDADLETFDEFSRLYEDPFSILLEEDHDDDDDDDDEEDDDDAEEGDAEEDEEDDE